MRRSAVPAFGILVLAASVVIAIAARLLPTAGAAVETSSLERVDGYGLPLVAYATVARSDGSYRRMLTQPETIEAVRSGAPPPDGTRILMETYYSPGVVSTVFHKMKADGRWLYGSFPAARPDLTVRPQASCLSCHSVAADTDFTFTLPSLWAAGRGGGESRFTCERGGRRPCDPSLYEAGAGQ